VDQALDAVVLLSWVGVIYCGGELMLLKMRQQGQTLSLSRTWIRCYAAAIGILFYPLVVAVSFGQIQTLLTALWMLAVIFWMKGKKGSAGLSLALICAFKPVLAVFAVWALPRKEWRFLSVFVGAAVLIQLVAIVLFGWRNELDYLSVLSYISHHGEAFTHNQSFNGLMQRWLGNGDMVKWQPQIYPPYRAGIYLATLATTGALLLFGLAAPLLRRWNDSTLDFILFGMISTVASPIAWEHHYSYFLVAMLYVLASRSTPLREFAFLTLCFSIVGNAFPFYEQLENTRWNPLISIPYFAGLGMIAVIVAILERTRSRTGSNQAVLGDSALVLRPQPD
jgi:hypothetical protein